MEQSDDVKQRSKRAGLHAQHLKPAGHSWHFFNQTSLRRCWCLDLMSSWTQKSLQFLLFTESEVQWSLVRSELLISLLTEYLLLFSLGSDVRPLDDLQTFWTSLSRSVTFTFYPLYSGLSFCLISNELIKREKREMAPLTHSAYKTSVLVQMKQIFLCWTKRQNDLTLKGDIWYKRKGCLVSRKLLYILLLYISYSHLLYFYIQTIYYRKRSPVMVHLCVSVLCDDPRL